MGNRNLSAISLGKYSKYVSHALLRKKDSLNIIISSRLDGLSTAVTLIARLRPLAMIRDLGKFCQFDPIAELKLTETIAIIKTPSVLSQAIAVKKFQVCY